MHGMEASGAPEIVKYGRSTVKLRRGSRVGVASPSSCFLVRDTQCKEAPRTGFIVRMCPQWQHKGVRVSCMCETIDSRTRRVSAGDSCTHSHSQCTKPRVATCRPRKPLKSESISHLAQINYSFLQCPTSPQLSYNSLSTHSLDTQRGSAL